MKTIFAGMIAIVTVIIFLAIDGYRLQYKNVEHLCQSSSQRVESTHDAINAIRNYQEELGPVGRILSLVRRTDAFQNDGYAIINQNDSGYKYPKGGGWWVEEWTTPGIGRVYSVHFQYFDFGYRPFAEIKYDVFECGAIDIRNCLTDG